MANFSIYNLNDNPFDISSHSQFMADRKSEMKKLESSLDTAFRSKGARFILIRGEYGVGKTHMINHIYFRFSQPVGEDQGVFAVRDILLEKPLTIMETEPSILKFGLNLIVRIFANMDPDKIREALNRVPSSEFKGIYRNLFMALATGDESAYLYLKAERLTTQELKKLGLRQPLSNSGTGLDIFFEWLRLLSYANYHTQLILTDEFELIPQILGTVKVTQVLNTFREIFDRSTRLPDSPQSAKPVFIFASSPGGWTTLVNLAQSTEKKSGGGGIAPFLRRIDPRDNIDLGPFSLDDTKELISRRLENYRNTTVKDNLFPFTEASINFIHEASFYKPANIIQYCSILLEDAVEEGLKEISENDAVNILSKYGIKVNPARESKGISRSHTDTTQ